MCPIHLRATPDDYAPFVLLPGDPQRARSIAERLDSPRLVNENRGLLGYTGKYKGASVSVQTTGMGCPSTAIVVEELIQLGTKTFLRVGTCGGIGRGISATDLVIATGACPVDGATLTYLDGDPYAPVASFPVIHHAVHAAQDAGVTYHTGPIATVDVFYNPDPGYVTTWASRGVLAFEMEASSIFYLAAKSGLQAGCLLTVSDVIQPGEEVSEEHFVSDEELARGVKRMIDVALETVLRLDQKQKNSHFNSVNSG